MEKESQRRADQRRNSIRTLIIWATVILALVGSVAAVAALSGGSNQENLPLSGEITAEDHIQGDPESAVVLVEYSDFQCPACSYYHPLVKEIVAEFGDRIAFVYRHFPLQQHKNAERAARAAEAAGRQGKFWEMHELIFANQEDWSDSNQAEDIFLVYADDLGLDGEKFRVDMDSPAVKDKVSNDYASGIQSGVTYTPTFYLNGEKISNPRSAEEFRGIIQAVLNQTP